MADGPEPSAVDAAPELGARYEATIPDGERAAHGRFYTPPPLSAACCRWALRADTAGDAAPRVLDPAAGAGAFVVAAVEHLRARDGATETAAGRVTAVDVDAEALAVTERRLDGAADAVTPVETDFLDCDPADLGRFDAVVGNPPYLRQEGLDKDAAREHLAAFGPDGATPYLDGDRALDRRSDAYVYFLTNATRFLRPGGRLAMVVPTKWLATRYGEPLQRFLLDHHRLHAVVGFDARAFDDALVDAAVLCCERLRVDVRSGDGTHDGSVRFTRTDAAGDTDSLAATLSGERAADARTVAVEQAALDDRGPGKWARYLDAPPALVELLSADGLVPLSALAEVTYGHKTGANDLFVLGPDDPVDDRFRAPALTSFRAVDGAVLPEGAAPAALLDVHDYVSSVLEGDESDPAETVLAAMDADGHDATAAYLRAGARAGYADRTTCSARRVWFDLGPLARPAVLHPKFFDERVRVVHNRAGAVPTNAIDCLAVDDDAPVASLLGALNSSLYRAALECWGRAEGGGALQLMTYELEGVPVPDVRAFDVAARDRLADAFHAYAAGDGDQRAVDAAVLDGLGLAVAPDRVAALREQMVRRRVDGAPASD